MESDPTVMLLGITTTNNGEKYKNTHNDPFMVRVIISARVLINVVVQARMLCNHCFTFPSLSDPGVHDAIQGFGEFSSDCVQVCWTLFLLSVNRLFLNPESLTLKKQPLLINKLLSLIFSPPNSKCELLLPFSRHSQISHFSQTGYETCFQGNSHPDTCKAFITGRSKLEQLENKL